MVISPRPELALGPVNARSRHVASSCNEEAGPPPCGRQSRSNPCPDGRDCLLGWRCCRGEWPVRHPPESSPGQLRHRGQVLPPKRRPVRRVWGWGKRDGSPQGERAGEAATPVRGAAWWNGAPVQAVAGRRRPGVQAGHLSATFALRVVNRCLRYDSAGPLSGQGRGQAFPRGLSPRRLRRETMLLSRQRIPRTAATSSVPPSPVGTRAAALPVPWL